uniref:Uncharacterized protein n=1 Tax=Octopus bimaculoides TaxID=37653 RepID=A0A0L8HQG2_OCTBM
MDTIMNAVLHYLQSETEKKFFCLNNIDAKFGFLVDIQSLPYPTHLDKVDLRSKCDLLASRYCGNINGKHFKKIIDCRALFSTRPEKLLEFIV